MIDRVSDQRLCVFCHDTIPSLLTVAHHYHKSERLKNAGRAGIDGTSILCWSCHLGLLHAGIITVEEVLDAEAATRAGTRKVTHDEVYRQIAAELGGRRNIDWRALHNRTPEQLSEAAVLANQSRTAEQRSKAAVLARRRRREPSPTGDMR